MLLALQNGWDNAGGYSMDKIPPARNDMQTQSITLRRHLSAIEAEADRLLEENNYLRRQLGVTERTCAALPTTIGMATIQPPKRTAARLDQTALVEAQKREDRAMLAQFQDIQEVLRIARQTRTYKVLRWLGRWKFMEPLPPQEPRDDRHLEFDGCYAMVREPKKRGWVDYSDGIEERIVERLRLLGLPVYDYKIDLADYRRYFAAARYLEDFPDYYPLYLPEKSLEHYLAAKLLQLNDMDIYIDIASQHSPVPEIYHRLFGAKTYRQDMKYPLGLNGDRIGGDAASMPMAEGFATKMALHCSFEHFEGDADIRFIREAARILGPGGAVCIVPLYLFEEYSIHTDPVTALKDGIEFEDDAIVCCVQDWNNRHGRFYDPEHLVSRLCNDLSRLNVEIYKISNFGEVDQACYARFAMLIKKL